jgi:hypothetical protein
VVSFPSVVSSVVIDRFNDERLRRKEQALCAAYLSLKNRELQFYKVHGEHYIQTGSHLL